MSLELNLKQKLGAVFSTAISEGIQGHLELAAQVNEKQVKG